MHAQTQSTIESLAEMGLIPPVVKQKGPRPASSYRAARRNHVKSFRKLPEWRQVTANYANHKADVAGRAVLANGAREAAAKAATGSAPGLPAHVNAAKATLNYYRMNGGGRAVSRIIRDLERQVRG